MDAFTWLEIPSDTRWTDEFLTWEPEDYGGVDMLTVPETFIWKPDLLPYNIVDGRRKFGSTEFLVKIMADGRIFWDPDFILETRCPVDITYFPFGTQMCQIELLSWELDRKQLALTTPQKIPSLDWCIKNGEFDIKGSSIVHFKEWSVDILKFSLVLKRRVLFYVFALVLPVVLLSLLCIVSYLVPMESGERMTISMTTLLSFTVYMGVVDELMPKTSENISLLVWLYEVVYCYAAIESVPQVDCPDVAVFSWRCDPWSSRSCTVLCLACLLITAQQVADGGLTAVEVVYVTTLLAISLMTVLGNATVLFFYYRWGKRMFPDRTSPHQADDTNSGPGGEPVSTVWNNCQPLTKKPDWQVNITRDHRHSLSVLGKLIEHGSGNESGNVIFESRSESNMVLNETNSDLTTNVLNKNTTPLSAAAATAANKNEHVANSTRKRSASEMASLVNLVLMFVATFFLLAAILVVGVIIWEHSSRPEPTVQQ
ncbi:neuronal acetylcholine receptor subunit beta-4-like [Gigantopelta aegis]|uniref:neuronal acetylcholine receptor subunit beta-4-like n=1 Tax=Gigantopelta aegis TaxID=1735272 RepID=UPI001B88C4D6|nr:neuronal acetylcholine receptor subunit beta-4-like [Gigantopelta aegis]